MIQKIIEVVGTSEQSFAKAAEAAVKEAAKTVRNIKWAHIDSFDMLLDGGKFSNTALPRKSILTLKARIGSKACRAGGGTFGPFCGFV